MSVQTPALPVRAEAGLSLRPNSILRDARLEGAHMRCPGCGCDNIEGLQCCAGRGSSVSAWCPIGSLANLPRHNFFGIRGTQLFPPSETSTTPTLNRASHRFTLTSGSILEAEHQQVAGLFAALKGLGALLSVGDAQDAAQLLDSALESLPETRPRDQSTGTPLTEHLTRAVFKVPLPYVVCSCWSVPRYSQTPPLEGRHTMKGIVFNLLEETVRREYGEDTWDTLLEAAGLDGVYTSLGNYPHEELLELITAASPILQMPAEAIIRWLGRHSIALLVKRYPEFFEPHKTTRSFLLTLNDVIHPEVRKIYPGADVPMFAYDTSSEEVLEMRYRSARKLCMFGQGLIEGAAAYYGEAVSIEHPRCMNRGDDQCEFKVLLTSGEA